MHKNRFYILLIISIISFYLSVDAQQCRTQIFDSSIKTLQIGRVGEKYSSNLIGLNSNEILKIKFDQLSHNSHAYSYKVVYCNADWSISNLSTTEYLNGYTSATINDVQLSNTTTFLYTHYQFDIPNSDMSFKLSGNYLVQIYEDSNIDKPIAQVCFSVCEPKITINHTLRANTDTELNGRMQQVDFELKLNGLIVQNPHNEIKVVVRQNNRYDNEVNNIVPTYINGQILSYTNNKSLIFEGGNEFHSFDISSVYAASRGVDRIKYIQPHYEVFLTQDNIQQSKAYNHEFDANGKFVINYQESVNNADTEADYMYVNFILLAKDPFLDGQIYLGGDFYYNLFNESSKVNYDFNAGMYTHRALVKQGGYNYQYRFLKKGNSISSVGKVEGSYWQTTNEYSIYVYFRPIGGRYDKLVAVKFFDK